MFEDRNKILVINVNWIGDVLLSTPFLKAIRGRFPHAFIACLVPSWCREALIDNPHINKVIVYDKRGRHKYLWGKLGLLKSIREERFDTAFILHRSRSRALLAYLSGARYRIGYNTKKRGFLLTTRIEPPKHEIHKIDYFLGIIRAVEKGEEKGDGSIFSPEAPKQQGKIEPSPFSRELVFVVNEADKTYICELLESEGINKDDFLVGLNPGANWEPKRWPTSGFAKVGDALAAKYNAKIVITGAVKDVSLAKDIAGQMTRSPFILAAKTTLGQLAALIKRCNLFITADSGPMHMAAAVGTPLVALFGPTSVRDTGPQGSAPYKVVQKKIECAPCTKIICSDNQCMKNIAPRDVLEAAEQLIRKEI